MAAPYFKTITNRQTFDTALAKDPDANLAYVPAGSSWGRQQLLACRVLGPPKFQLKLIADKAAYDSSVIDALINQKPPYSFKDLALRPAADILQYFSRRQLAELGPFWAAMAAIKAAPNRPAPPAVTPVNRLFSSRARQAPQHFPGMVAPPSSSSRSRSSDSSSGAQSQSEEEYIDAAAHTSAAVAEDATVQVASAFVTCVLANLPSAVFRDQDGAAVDPPPAVTVEFCGIRRDLVVGLPSEQDIRATGDGEILARKLVANANPPRYDHDHRRPIVILEAKKRFNIISDGGSLSIKDELFGQLAAEAITARHQNPVVGHANVHVLFAAQHWLQVFQFAIPAGHIDALKAGTPLSTFIKVQATGLFDLRYRAGRKSAVMALTHLAQLLHEAPPDDNSQSSQGDDEDSENGENDSADDMDVDDSNSDDE